MTSRRRWRRSKASKSSRLDLTSERSVQELSMDIGAKVEILVNTADHVRPAHLFDAGAANAVREAMDHTVMGLMRLAQAFGPVMRSRGADGAAGAAAWVNVLSVHGLSNVPQFGVHSAAHAACLSLSQWLRSETQTGRYPGRQRIHRAARYRMVPDGAAAQSGAQGPGRRCSRRIEART
ncbi:SDR family NAD(P)-dependent oxidoreductase [Neorhizobium galegae]|nr:SDR family NAD(P)-dependent oxidoreductase [Neorhizobium galegae]